MRRHRTSTAVLLLVCLALRGASDVHAKTTPSSDHRGLIKQRQADVRDHARGRDIRGPRNIYVYGLSRAETRALLLQPLLGPVRGQAAFPATARTIAWPPWARLLAIGAGPPRRKTGGCGSSYSHCDWEREGRTVCLARDTSFTGQSPGGPSIDVPGVGVRHGKIVSVL